MKKILLSIATLGIVGAAVVGGTTAIFSDTEVSTGNTFTAGAIDLTVDNESYYNGVLNKGTTWFEPANLDDGEGPGVEGAYFFFDFHDLKPGDWGEDTISLHVNNNDSYLCADVTLTSNQDNGSTEPELNDENPWTGEGELADNVHFIWWADDGDNVYEEDEELLPAGPLGYLGVGQTATVALADANTNIWNDDQIGGPLPGDSVRYIGKAWCFGEMTIDPATPGDNDPEVYAGFSCSGASEDNSTQTDSMTADVVFRAIQSRHNDGFVCEPLTEPTTATLTVDKIITFSDPDLDPVEISDFTFLLNGPGTVNLEVFDEVSVPGLTPGTYTVSETGPDGFVAQYGLDCNSIGEVTLAAGSNETCRIINIDERNSL